MEQTNQKIAMKVSVISIFINLALSFFKLIAGIYANSGAMISDAVHSASDVFSTFVVMLGVKISSKKSDEDHQYGHERLECVAAIILSVTLLATGLFIAIHAFGKIIEGKFEELQVPGILALIAAAVSILTKEWMFWYTRAAAKKINSGALMADAWHHRSDALSSVGAFIGIAGARLGFPVLDLVVSLIICILIGKAAYDIFKDAVNKMVDKSCDDETVEKMKQLIQIQDGVIAIDMIKTRLFGAKIYVDIEIVADGNLTLIESHKIAEQVHHTIEREFCMVKHCMVHVNPTIENKKE